MSFKRAYILGPLACRHDSMCDGSSQANFTVDSDMDVES